MTLPPPRSALLELFLLARHLSGCVVSNVFLWIESQSMEERAKHCPLAPVTVEHAGGAATIVATGERGLIFYFSSPYRQSS